MEVAGHIISDSLIMADFGCFLNCESMQKPSNSWYPSIMTSVSEQLQNLADRKRCYVREDKWALGH